MPESTGSSQGGSAGKSLNYPIRPHSSILILQVIGIQMVGGIIAVLVRYPLLAFGDTLAADFAPETLYVFFTLFLQLANAGFTVAVVLAWVHTLYIIRPGEILVQRGIWQVQEESYKLDRLELLKVQQSPLARALNYGTIRFRYPPTTEELQMENIPNPYYYVTVIRRTQGEGEMPILPPTVLPPTTPAPPA